VENLFLLTEHQQNETDRKTFFKLLYTPKKLRSKRYQTEIESKTI